MACWRYRFAPRGLYAYVMMCPDMARRLRMFRVAHVIIVYVCT